MAEMSEFSVCWLIALPLTTAAFVGTAKRGRGHAAAEEDEEDEEPLHAPGMLQGAPVEGLESPWETGTSSSITRRTLSAAGAPSAMGTSSCDRSSR